MRKNIPMGLVNIISQLYFKWHEHPDNLPEKYFDINDGIDILYEMIKDNIIVIETSEKY